MKNQKLLMSLLSLGLLFALAPKVNSQEAEHKCMSKKTEANCYVEFFEFHAATDVSSKKDSDEFLSDISKDIGLDDPRKSALTASSYFLVDNFSNLVMGQVGGSMISFSGLNLIQGILTNFTDTRRGMSLNMNISFQDDEINKNNELFIDKYKSAFLQAAQDISEEPVQALVKESKTIFGVTQYRFGAIIKNKNCPGSSNEQSVACIYQSTAISSAMNGRGAIKSSLKGQEKHYRVESFLTFDLDWGVPKNAKQEMMLEQRKNMAFKTAEKLPGQYFVFVPRNKHQKVGFFYDGNRLMPYSFKN